MRTGISELPNEASLGNDGVALPGTRRRAVAGEDRLSIAQPITGAHLEALVRPAMKAGLRRRAVGTNGRRGAWTAATVRSAWSQTRHALVQAILETLPQDERSTARAQWQLQQTWDTRDLRPLLARLPEYAARTRRTVGSRGTATRAVRALLRRLVAGLSAKNPVALRAGMLLPEWQILVAAVQGLPTTEADPSSREQSLSAKTRASLVTGIMLLAETASAHGLLPTELLESTVRFHEWFDATSLKAWQKSAVRWSMGRVQALGIVGTEHFPSFPRGTVARRLGSTAEAHSLALRACAPALATHIEKWARTHGPLAEARTSGVVKRLLLAPATRANLLNTLHRVCTRCVEALSAGVVPNALANATNVIAWYTTRVPINGAVPELLEEDADVDDLRADTAPGDETRGGNTEDMSGNNECTIPAILAVMLHAARSEQMGRRYGIDQQLPRRAITSGALIDMLPVSVVSDLADLWSTIVHRLESRSAKQRKNMTPGDREIEATAAAAHAEIMDMLLPPGVAEGRGARRRTRPTTVKDKRLLVDLMPLPVVLAIYIPSWTLIALPRIRERLHAIRTRIARVNAKAPLEQRWEPGEHAEEAAAARAYKNALCEWLALAAFTADPSRIKNLWCARVGLHGSDSKKEIAIDALWNRDGSLRRIRGVTATYGGIAWATMQENDRASLKNRKFGQRSFAWAAVAVDPEWLAAYLRDYWLPALKTRGLVTEHTTLHAALERSVFPLFVTDGGTQSKRITSAPRPGGFAGADSLRTLYARGMLHAMHGADLIREGVVTGALPSTDAEAKKRWPWLLAPQGARTIWTSHLVGVLHHGGSALRRRLPSGEIERVDASAYAVKATTSRLVTLEKEYLAIGDAVELSLTRAPRHWRHPRAFDPVVDLLVAVDVRPPFARWWSEWTAQSSADDEVNLLPVALREAWSARQRNADLELPALRRKGRGTDSESREEAA